MLDEVKKEIDQKFSEGDLTRAIFIAGGFFSACWTGKQEGRFDNENAEAMADFLSERINAHVRREIQRGLSGVQVDAHIVKTGLSGPTTDPHSAGSGRHNPEAEHRGSER